MAAEFGVSFDGFESTALALKTAHEAMAAGARSLWMAEHMGYREAMVTSMGFRMNDSAAFVVPTAVSPYLWHPSPTAMALATLAELGEAPVGIAVGIGNPMFLRESGKEAAKPLRAVREFTECLRALWSGEPVHHQGQFFTLAGAQLGFKPPQPLIIYIAAIGPQMLTLSGEIGDGIVLSAGLSPEFCKVSLEKVAQGAAKAGRDAGALRRAAYLLFAVSDDGKTAVEIVRAKLAFLLRNKALQPNIALTGIPVDQERIMDAVSRRALDDATRLVSDDAVEAFAVAGTPAACRKRLSAFLDSGIVEPVLMIQGAGPEREAGLRFLREVAGEARVASPNSRAEPALSLKGSPNE